MVANIAYLVVLVENPQVMPRSPPPIRMARWPKTPVELERSIGAECVRTIRRERELHYLGFSAGT